MVIDRFVRLAALGSLVLLGALLTPPPPAQACTNVLVTKGASVDGSTMITYAADSHELYGELYFRPRSTNKPGTMVEVRDWDSNKLLGKIPQAAQTNRVVGNMNEHQLVIAETTFGGRKELRNKKGGLDYGSLIYFALQRAKTAREAIKVMTDLAAAHGYYSAGESFSLADPKEVWIMDMIGKGPGVKGAVWVARRVPDGYVTAHANQTRIRKFPRKDPANCLYAKDVISFARKKGYFKGKDADFAFADVYAPMTCRDLRVREARVWAVLNKLAPSLKISPDYAACKPGAQPMPLWVKPDKKVGPTDLFGVMRDHFEGTPFDMTKDVGAGPYSRPYRWRPLVWKHKGKSYVNERAIATQQTGFSFISQSRDWLPGPIGGLLWFSVDDAASTVNIPIYVGITEAPRPYAVGTGSFTKWSWDSAFWIFNWVSNFVYTRYSDIIKDVQLAQQGFEKMFLADQKRIEALAMIQYKIDPAKCEAFLTAYSAQSANAVVARWKKLGTELLMKFLDGNVRDAKGKITHPPWPAHWRDRIIAETGDHFLIKKRGADAQAKATATALTAKGKAATPGAKPGAKPTPKAKKIKGLGCRGSFRGLGTALPFLLLFGLILPARRRPR